MAKESGIEVEGTVIEARGSGFFSVKLENGCEVLARPNGKMSKHFIKILPNDRVLVEVSPYDLTRGRITYRYK